MGKFVPYEKLSKKEKRRRNAEKRGVWGSISPVTRKSKKPKAYKRKKAQLSDDDAVPFFFQGIICPGST